MNLAGLPYALEPMQLSDVPTVSTVERQVFTTPWSIQAFRQEILYHDTATYLVLRYLGDGDGDGKGRSLLRRPWGTRHDCTLLGYGGVWMMLDEGHICTLALRPSWRGHGLGELVFAALIEQALQAGAKGVTLEVRVSNLVGQQLYAKYGLEPAGLRKRYYPDNQEDALIMTASELGTAAYRQAFQARVDALLRRLQAAEPPDAREMGQGSGRTES